jgi:hypothetical protein
MNVRVDLVVKNGAYKARAEKEEAGSPKAEANPIANQ